MSSFNTVFSPGQITKLSNQKLTPNWKSLKKFLKKRNSRNRMGTRGSKTKKAMAKPI